MTTFHMPTVMVALSFLYLMMPLAVWLALSGQRLKTIIGWCVGGELLAIGLLLIGLRPLLPAWASYPIANILTWGGILIQALALRYALNLTWKAKYMALVIVFWLAIFEYLRLGLQNQHARFAWSILFFIAVFGYIAYLAWRISAEQGLKSGRILFAVYAIATGVLFIRMLRIAFGLTEPDAVAQGVDTFLIVFSGFVVSVFGSFSFVGMFVERATRIQMQATHAHAKQSESMRLGGQISHLERQRTLGAMSYAFAHELSQPLTAILMDVHAIKSNLESASFNAHAVKQSIDDIESNASRTGQLINRIRNFIRPSESDYENVDMKVLVKDVKELLSYDIRSQKITFEWGFDQDDCLVQGDRIQLSQIFLNIYRNALQAMADSRVRKIFVSIERQAQRVVVHVRDSGPGLADAIKDNVGDAFVTTKADGLGVGLSISKTIAEIHHGSLTITNAVDGGALVELNLPAVMV